MKITILVLFYTVIFALLGTLAVAFAFHLIDIQDIILQLGFAYQDLQVRVMTGLWGLVLILMSLSSAQALTGKIQRERTIAFTNPNGQVTITLSAVEDLIKRLATQMSEIKDARAEVRATKKGIDIEMRVILRCEVNIPDFTNKLQNIITSKVQEVFGIEEAINVRIHVAKIVTGEKKQKRKTQVQEEPQEEEIGIPYQGINL